MFHVQSLLVSNNFLIACVCTMCCIEAYFRLRFCLQYAFLTCIYAHFHEWVKTITKLYSEFNRKNIRKHHFFVLTTFFECILFSTKYILDTCRKEKSTSEADKIELTKDAPAVVPLLSRHGYDSDVRQCPVNACLFVWVATIFRESSHETTS